MNKFYLLFFILLFYSCIVKNEYVYVSPEHVEEETLIINQSKIISRGYIYFLRKKEGKYELLSFSYRISLKQHTVDCTLRERKIYDISDGIIPNRWLTADEFRRCKYYNSIFEEYYNCFIANFLELSNDEKIKVLERISLRTIE